jgi:hypothetical protein
VRQIYSVQTIVKFDKIREILASNLRTAEPNEKKCLTKLKKIRTLSSSKLPIHGFLKGQSHEKVCEIMT